MGLLDDTIAAVKNLGSSAGSLVTDNVGSVTGAVETAVGSVVDVAEAAIDVPLGVAGDVGEVGQKFIDLGTEGRIVINTQPIRPLDMSRVQGGFWSGGNGQFATRTTVERINVTTGAVSIVSRMPGSPHLMNSDVTAMKRTLKVVSSLNKRVPRKTVKESEMKKLTNAAVQAATRNVAAVDCCPPKC